MRRYLVVGLVIALGFGLTACTPKERIETLQGPTMGSTYTVKYVRGPNMPAPDKVNVELQSILNQVDRQMSTYRADSDLSEFNRLPAGSCQTMPEPVLQLVRYGQQLAESSGGAFDLTIGPLLDVWGFGPHSRGRVQPSAEQIEQARSRVGYQYLKIEQNQLCKEKALEVDLNSIAAGYTVDQVAERFQSLGIDSYMIEITGELKAAGKKPDGSAWRIAIEEPNLEGQRIVQRILPIDGLGVNTSGDYRNYYEENGQRFSHTLDPNLAAPIQHKLAAVTVIDPSTLAADALGTLLLVLGPDAGKAYAELHQIAALFVSRVDDGFVTETSSAFDQLFPTGEQP